MGAFSLPVVSNPPLPVLVGPGPYAEVHLTFLPNYFNLSSSQWTYDFLDHLTQTLATLLILPYVNIGNMSIVSVQDPVYAANTTLAGQGRIVVSALVRPTVVYSFNTSAVIVALNSFIASRVVLFNLATVSSTYVVASLTVPPAASTSDGGLTSDQWVAVAMGLAILIFLLAVLLYYCHKRHTTAMVSPSSKAVARPLGQPAAGVHSLAGSSKAVIVASSPSHLGEIISLLHHFIP